jgi:hypothetical protein
MKKMRVRLAPLQKVQPPSRYFWVGLIVCLPGIIGAQEPLKEPVKSEPKAAVEESQKALPAPVAENKSDPATNTAQPEPVKAPEPVSTPVIASEPLKAPEPVQNQVIATEPVKAPEPAPVIAAEPHATPAIAAEPAKPAEPAPVIAAEPTKETVPAVQAAAPEKAPPLCRKPNPAEPAAHRPLTTSTVGMAPLSHGNMVLELIYWEAIEDSLRFAMKNCPAASVGATAAVTDSPLCPAVNQRLGYDPGARASVFVPILYDEWELGATYTYFYTTPPVSRVNDPRGYLYANLESSALGNFSAAQSLTSAKSKWNLKMNVVDLELRRPFVIGQALMLEPIMGAKASFVRQKYDVHYGFFTPGTGQANRVIGTSSVWALGPEFGAEMRFLIPKQVSFSVKGMFAAMMGIFSGNTLYTEYYETDEEMSLTEKKTRLFEVGQLQCGFSKWWAIKNESSLELTLGWEAQIWWRQMRMNWMSTATLPPQGADLTIQGPFFRGSWNF